MASPGPRYRRIEEELPAVYRRDEESWAQIQSYFEPLNGVFREFILALGELPAWLSPAAPSVTPPGRFDAGPGEILRRQSQVLDELASWFDFEFEPAFVWGLPELDSSDEGDMVAARRLVEDKAELLKRLPRLMRSRATPTGFLELLCATFRLDPESPDECPLLIEHWAWRKEAEDRSQPRGGGVDVDDGVVWRVSILLKCLGPGPPDRSWVDAKFSSWTHLRTLEEWIDVHAPAHLSIEVHPVAEHYWGELPERLDRTPDADDLASLLRDVRVHVLDEEGLALLASNEDEFGWQLDFGRMPGEHETDPGDSHREPPDEAED